MQEGKANNLHLKFKKICAEKGLKVTPQRMAIYKELMIANDHPSADVIFKRIKIELPNISFDTVYRTLLTLSEHRIVSVVEGYGENKRFETNMDNHHHFRCIKCHTIIDFINDEYDHIGVPKDLSAQFTVINKKVVLEGICSKCKK